jgi:hypothetical protein
MTEPILQAVDVVKFLGRGAGRVEALILVDLAEGGPLAVGMKVDVYFRHDNSARQ